MHNALDTHARFEQTANKLKELIVHHLLSQAAKDGLVRDLVETRLDVSLDDPGKTFLRHLLTTRHRVMRASVGPKPVRIVVELRLVDRFERHANDLLNDLVTDTRNAQASLFAIGLGNHHASQRLRLVGPTLQFQA